MPFFGGGGDYHIVGTNIDGGNDVLSVTTGDYNIGIGNGALQNDTTGSNNVAVGNNTLNALTSGNSNIAIGSDALLSFTFQVDAAQPNIAIGTGALYSNQGGSGNVAIGAQSLFSYNGNTEGRNVSIGQESMYYGAGAHSNVAVGAFALTGGAAATNYNHNIAIGRESGFNVSTATQNVMIGAYSGLSLTTGAQNIFIGDQCGLYIQSGSGNIAIGSTGVDTASGAVVNNIVIGNNTTLYGAGAQANNIIVGNSSGSDFNNTILLGGALAATVDNQIIIGDASHTSVTIGGVQLAGTNGAAFPSGAIIGDPGTEGAGIDVNGVTYNSTFKVSDIDGTNYAQTILHRHSTTLEPLIVGARSNSNTSAHAAVVNGMNLFSVYGVGYTGTHYDIFGTINIAADSSGTISATSSPGAIIFSVTPNGSNAPAQALKIDNTKLATFADGVSMAGSLTFTGSANRVLGDFSNATVANRLAFQTSSLNNSTFVEVLPSGTSAICGINLENSSSPLNNAVGSLYIDNTEVRLQSLVRGTGTALPININVNGITSITFDISNNVNIPNGNFTISGSSKRITGDFSNATFSNRLLFQTSTANGNTSLGIIPNGTSKVSNVICYDSQDPNNSSFIQLRTNNAEAANSVNSGAVGTGTLKPLGLMMNSVEKARVSTAGDFEVITAGNGLRVKEGSNAKQGTAVLVAGSVTVNNTSVTANSRIFLTSQADGGTPGFLRVSARVAGTSFTITSSNALDTSTVAYEIFEPA